MNTFEQVWTILNKFWQVWTSLNTIWQVVKKAYLILCRWAYSSSSDKIKFTSLTRMDSVLTWLKIFLIPSNSSIIFNKFGNDDARPKKLIAHCFPDTWEHSISLEVGFFLWICLTHLTFKLCSFIGPQQFWTCPNFLGRFETFLVNIFFKKSVCSLVTSVRNKILAMQNQH